MSSKSLSLAKSQHKKLNNTANLKIYTSVGWSKSKKQWAHQPIITIYKPIMYIFYFHS